MKNLLLRSAAALSVAFASVPAIAQDDPAPSGAQLEQFGEMFAGLFSSEPLTPEQEARLPQAAALVETMVPQGFYAEMMGEMMETTMGPMLSMFSGAEGAQLVLGSRLGLDPEAMEKLTDDEKTELAAMLDPAFAKRGTVIQDVINDMMVETAVLIEPGFREGLAKAYAVRFDEAQLADIAAFFATPTGALYARENMKLMADPQVMSASMQAMPAMMEQFGDIDKKMEAAMAALPAEREVSDLDASERARMAQLLGVEAASLEYYVVPLTGSSDEDWQEGEYGEEAPAEEVVEPAA